jgi:alpha-beta hydrolase superfamily lysophospholipase
MEFPTQEAIMVQTAREEQTVKEEMFDGVGGLRIFLRSWRPEGTPRAVIVICHGVNSHGRQYAWAAEQFVKSGVAVYALDLRGRGKSEGERFYLEDVAEYASDVAGAVTIANEGPTTTCSTTSARRA